MPKDRSSRMAPRCWGLAISVLVLSMSAAAEVSAALRAGVAAVNITADKPTEPVHDPLMAKALVLEDGGNRVVIISMDIVVAEDAIVSAVRRGVQQGARHRPVPRFAERFAQSSHGRSRSEGHGAADRCGREAGQSEHGGGADWQRRRAGRSDHRESPSPHQGWKALGDSPRHAVACRCRRDRDGASRSADRLAAWIRWQGSRWLWCTISPAMPTAACPAAG